MGSVYLIGDWEREGFYKIGVTTGSIDKRIKKLQTGNSSELYLVKHHETEHPFFIESRLHQKYNSSNVLNEWFELDKEDVKNFEQSCLDIENMIKSLADNPFFPKNLK